MFWILHIIALLVFFPALFVTIPLHIIAGLVRSPTSGFTGWVNYMDCPQCKEKVKRNALVCKHCGAKLKKKKKKSEPSTFDPVSNGIQDRSKRFIKTYKRADEIISAIQLKHGIIFTDDEIFYIKNTITNVDQLKELVNKKIKGRL